ncbi:MAG: bifunctional DNA-formamidopyrimidine glycosylase/DNA-(apurinic or apyrimidinic site) lyase [Gammaproteobacteria bacterium]|nr:bifunctional DNA-formamidopyrimidine glycosylase/DNA-(apurinic or apyrimidinic site) lyase [Gammaproteobacteria bacterium]
MPELPEVETTRRGIAVHLEGKQIISAAIRERRLRWPIQKNLSKILVNQKIQRVTRRGKYIILTADCGSLIVHLGMSGSLRLVSQSCAPEKHDHYDIVLETGKVLRYRDPRRFGSLFWTTSDPLSHWLLEKLGPEPLSADFTGDYMFRISRGKKRNIKSFIMDSQVVPGIGNIYANEALFTSEIRPGLASGRMSAKRYERLVASIKQVLTVAIQQGGTTLRDFVDSDGRPGYFKQSLFVYGRAGENCDRCNGTIKSRVLSQRATYYCPNCQH